jgi:iron(III) transport system permease protein
MRGFHGLQRRPLGALGWSALAVAALIVAPLLAVVGNVFAPGDSTWAHLVSTVLPGYVRNTALLLVGVTWGVVSIGVLSAWLVTAYRFPGQRVLEWALILPLAMPAYVMAYAYTDWLQFSGPVQSALRAATGWQAREYWFPEIRSLYGAAAMFSFALYPYVYLLARTAFLEQSRSAIEAGRLAGYGAWGTFFRVALPLARPAIAAGTALALMETLADFGTVQYFGVNTFTTGIYRTWFALGEPAAAAQLAGVLMLIVLLVLTLERASRGLAKYQHTAQSRLRSCYALGGRRALLATAACALPVGLGFAVPVLVLVNMTLNRGDARLGGMFLELAANSFGLAALAALVTTAVALVVGYGLRLRPGALTRGAARIAGLGYAIPGAVIAVGVLLPFARLDNALDAWMRASFGISTGLLLTGTVGVLLFAYLVRFLALALSTVEAGLAKINRNLDDAARVLGRSPARTLLRVHVPLLWGSVLTAVILVFVDVLKELPATLILRPFNFETLAVRVYRFASDERLAEASTAALAIVLVGLLPVILLSRAIARTHPDRAAEPSPAPSAVLASPSSSI